MAQTIKKETRHAIVAQISEEMAFARRYKQTKISNWHKNENLYYGSKKKTDESRANVDLGQMQEHVHTLLSKIDNPLTFKFTKRKNSQTRRVSRLNALKDFDADRNFWDIKDITGKKQAVLYGRAIYCYSASSHDGYQPHLDNVDVYDFLIDPSAGGIDLENARFMGRYGVVKDRYDLKGHKDYIKTEVDVLLSGKGNNTTRTQEQQNKENRIRANEHTDKDKEKPQEDKFVFWEWFTTYKGQRYYALVTDNGEQAIRMEKLDDMFESNLWPFWTYATYPDLTEFWTPSPCDYVREIIMAQAVSINQMLDNAERVNKPQRIVDVTAIQDLSQLKYRRDGYIEASTGTAQNALRTIETPSIDTPLSVFQQLENIKQQASGVTAGALGVADTDGRATIYEGNQQNVADRFGLFNKSYSFGYKRFAQLWEHGVREHLRKKVAVDIIGPEGIEMEMIGRSDVFRKNDTYAVMTEQSNAELAISEQKKRALAAYYSALLGQPIVNQQVIIERLGTIAGETPETIRQLLEIDKYGDAELMAEADKDIEELVDGKVLTPNRRANAAYKQRFVHYMMDNEKDLSPEELQRMVRYVQSLDVIIMQNTMREAQERARQEMEAQVGVQGGAQQNPQLRSPGPAQPLQDVINQNVQN